MNSLKLVLKPDDIPGEVSRRIVGDVRHEQCALEGLDRLSRTVRTSHIIDIVGVLADIKPSSLIPHDPDLVAAINDLALTSFVFEYEPGEPYGMAVSKDPCLAEELARLVEDGGGNTAAWIRNVGSLLGYPKSATDYYILRHFTLDHGHERELPFIVPEYTVGTVREAFHYFAFSPDHWREETANFVVPLERAVQNWTPQTYAKIEESVRLRKKTSLVLGMQGTWPAVERIPEAARIEYVA